MFGLCACRAGAEEGGDAHDKGGDVAVAVARMSACAATSDDEDAAAGVGRNEDELNEHERSGCCCCACIAWRQRGRETLWCVSLSLCNHMCSSVSSLLLSTLVSSALPSLGCARKAKRDTRDKRSQLFAIPPHHIVAKQEKAQKVGHKKSSHHVAFHLSLSLSLPPPHAVVARDIGHVMCVGRHKDSSSGFACAGSARARFAMVMARRVGMERRMGRGWAGW